MARLNTRHHGEHFFTGTMGYLPHHSCKTRKSTDLHI